METLFLWRHLQFPVSFFSLLSSCIPLLHLLMYELTLIEVKVRIPAKVVLAQLHSNSDKEFEKSLAVSLCECFS